MTKAGVSRQASIYSRAHPLSLSKTKASHRRSNSGLRWVKSSAYSYPAAKAEIPELENVKHVFVKASARVNNCAEKSHQPTREHERRMRGFPSS